MSEPLSGYLSALPEPARYAADASRGEIEILTEPGRIREIAGARAAALGVVFEDEYMVVVRDPVRFPSGVLGTYLRIFPRPALSGATGAVMLPMRGGKVLLRRVFRHATRAWELECPRGFRAAGVEVTETAHAEVQEELGLPVTGIRPLGRVHGDTGLIAGYTMAFLVTVAEGQDRPAPEPREAIGGLEILSPERLSALMTEGEIRDGYTLSAIALAQAHGLFFLPPSGP